MVDVAFVDVSYTGNFGQLIHHPGYPLNVGGIRESPFTLVTHHRSY
jgi:hypothetical protein